MKTIQQLQEQAAMEQAKAEDLRQLAERRRQRAELEADNPAASQRIYDEAQKYEDQAIIHDRTAAEATKTAADLEAQAQELNRRKNEIQATSQAQIDRLDQEEKMLRGDSRGMF